MQEPVILIAEDNADWSSMMSDYLQAKGYKVVTACDGIEACEKAETSNPNLILMDLDMPRMNGTEATRSIRAHTRLGRTPILMLSAFATKSDRASCMAAGANRFLPKPFPLNNLADAIASELAR